MLGDQSSGISFAAARIRSICSGSETGRGQDQRQLVLPAGLQDCFGRLGDREIDDHVDRHEQFGRQGHAQGPRAGDDAGVVAQKGVVRRFQGRGHRQLRIGRAQGDQAAAHAAGRTVNGYANAVMSLSPLPARIVNSYAPGVPGPGRHDCSIPAPP